MVKIRAKYMEISVPLHYDDHNYNNNTHKRSMITITRRTTIIMAIDMSLTVLKNKSIIISEMNLHMNSKTE